MGIKSLNEKPNEMSVIKVCKQRFHSGDRYWRNPEFQKLGKPLIINIRTTHLKRVREEADEDVKCLEEKLSKFGFDKPYKLDDKVDDCLQDRRSLLDKLKEVANDDEMTKQVDVFLCIIMAYGGSNFISLAESKSGTPEEGKDRVDIQDVVSVFKADNCPKLVCKPKVFIIHTEDSSLHFYKPEEFGKDQVEKAISKVPIEADLMIYHSEMSARYVRYMASNKPLMYEELMGSAYNLVEKLDAIVEKCESDDEDVKTEDVNPKQKETPNIRKREKNTYEQDPDSSSGQNDPSDERNKFDTENSVTEDDNQEDKRESDEKEPDEKEDDSDDDDDDDDETDSDEENENDPRKFVTKRTHFIFTLCQAADELVKEKCFDVNKWVFLTNKKLKEFIKTRYWKPLRKHGIWNKNPRLPICTIQLTKRLAVDLE